MEMSTSLRPNLRRSVLNSTLMRSRAPFRRSLPGPSNTPIPPAALDEEKERSDRRSRVAMRRSLTNITSSTDGSPLLDAIPLMGENQIWKVKFIRRSTARYSGATVQQIKDTKKVKTLQSQSFEDVCETLETFVHKRARPTVAFEKITLPAPSTELSFEWFNNVMGHLLIKSATLHPRILKQKDQKPGACEVPGYNYENLNESMYCSQHNGININDNDPIHDSSEDSFEQDVPPAAQQTIPRRQSG